MDVEMDTFLDFAPLLTLYLTLSASHFHPSSPSHLRQHFCLSMNIWMRLKHWYTRVRAHSIAPSSPARSARTTPGHKHFINTFLVKSNVRWLFANFIAVNSLRVGKISADGINFAQNKVFKKIAKYNGGVKSTSWWESPAVRRHPVWLFALNQLTASTSTSK